MAGKVGNKNAAGKHNTDPLNDRVKLSKLRELATDRVMQVLSQPVVQMSVGDYQFYKEILLKLAGTILPRLTDIASPDGGPVQVEVVRYGDGKNTPPAPVRAA